MSNQPNQNEGKIRRLKRKHIKLILELILMGIAGFLVLYPFMLFFINFLI
ncbi:MAG: hypothetical protein ACFE85_16020 [Candidatus Hodarchaeota archaeon]